ncbi:MAG: thioredoxin domain-containing protein [Deltaproteobacteria bacterium]|nr:thioredoxin domain-containing protein [Deltaproteobacteria bacterium]
MADRHDDEPEGNTEDARTDEPGPTDADAVDEDASDDAVDEDAGEQPGDDAAKQDSTAAASSGGGSSMFGRAFGIVAFLAALGGGFWIGQYIQRDDGPFRGYQDETRYRVELRGNEPQRGPDDALVTIIEFSDYECPYCKAADEPLQEAVDDNDDVRLIFKHYPLPMHANAIPAARAAWAAQQQGKFWEMHEHLFEAGGKVEAIDEAARDMGLDVARFRQDMLSEAAKEAIESDRHAAGLLGIGSTPHFVINGRHVRGALADSHWEAVFEREREDAEAILDEGSARASLFEHLMSTAKGRRKAPARGPDASKRHAIGPGEGSPSLGPEDALVTIVEFSDFQCPFCARLAPTVHTLPQRHPDVRVVFRQLPLPNHAAARPAAKAALAAQRQGKFWEMHDAMFEAGGKIDADDLPDLARGIGLDMDRYAQDVEDPEIEAMIARDEAAAREVGVRGTPASFINGRFVGGAQSAQRLDEIIEQERRVAQGLIDAGTPPDRLWQAVLEQPPGGAN